MTRYESTTATQAASKELRNLMEARHLATAPEAEIITHRIRLVLESMDVETRRWREQRPAAETTLRDVVRAVWKGIESGDYQYPTRIESADGAACVCIRLMDVIRYLRRAPALVRLREGSPASFKRSSTLGLELARAGYLVMDSTGESHLTIERTIRKRREGHLVMLRCAPIEREPLNGSAATEPVIDADLS